MLTATSCLSHNSTTMNLCLCWIQNFSNAFRSIKIISMEFSNIIPQWAEDLNCAITVCDENCSIIFMNKRSRETFCKHGSLIGKNLIDCHSPRSVEIIRRLLSDGTPIPTPSKRTDSSRWFIRQPGCKEDGTIGGLVEISMVIPEHLPHYKRNWFTMQQRHPACKPQHIIIWHLK